MQVSHLPRHVPLSSALPARVDVLLPMPPSLLCLALSRGARMLGTCGEPAPRLSTGLQPALVSPGRGTSDSRPARLSLVLNNESSGRGEDRVTCAGVWRCPARLGSARLGSARVGSGRLEASNASRSPCWWTASCSAACLR
ncbi:hypothetical protein H696_03630 [Fonticula alba]|uniref:Uncharacterized protein n=1 Tax=Fonticula alba TaxID=691883 RepID=A0A058Z7S8_FONAL|nr:hypothetical protein H696_03630 [Fonticula alba]KCV70171.1 hypothetical protein H696_03630 [Fonticula alba]|eukprot:XP_009495777.1 hypothetical protein H696_03630 [Fonticula alba]